MAQTDRKSGTCTARDMQQEPRQGCPSGTIGEDAT